MFDPLRHRSALPCCARRQAERTTSSFGIRVFMLKPPPQLFRRNVLATSPGESKPKSCLIACEKAARITNRPLPSVRSHPKEADGRTDSVHCFSTNCSGTPSIRNTADGNSKTLYFKLPESPPSSTIAFTRSYPASPY